MNTLQVVEEVYRHDLIADIEVDLKGATRANDRLAFGMYRPEIVQDLREQLEKARNKIDNILRRLP